jgi:geranylgeranyl pyrophosphate synthase
MPNAANALRADAERFQRAAQRTVALWHKDLDSLSDNSLVRNNLKADLLEPARYAFLGSGKGLRPMLTAWAWRTLSKDWAPDVAFPQAIEDLAMAVEILHAASLIIDDIQDGSAERRSKPALHVAYGVPVAINTANWLYFEAISPLGTEDLHRAMHMMRRCHVGQALDLAAARSKTVAGFADASHPVLEGYYAAAASFKTAELMTFAIRGAEQHTKQPPQAVDLRTVHWVADHLGHVYQRVDDLRNMSSVLSGAKAGEDLGSLRNHVVLDMLSRLDETSRQKFLTRQKQGIEQRWLRQDSLFTEAMVSSLTNVTKDLQSLKDHAQASSSCCLDYLNQSVLNTLEAVVAQVRSEVVL